MNYDNFKKWATVQNAETLDYDGVYGLQCVDLIKWYVKKVRGIAPQSIGNAIDYYKKRNSDYVQEVTAGGGAYVLTSATKSVKFEYLKGDIIVFTGGKCGHIAIFDSRKGDNVITVLDTNYKGTHSTAKLHDYNIKNRPVACVLRISPKLAQPYNYFTPNATILNNAICYADMKCTFETGEVFKGERVRVQFIGNKLALIQYTTSDGYKVGLISKNKVKKDK